MGDVVRWILVVPIAFLAWLLIGDLGIPLLANMIMWLGSVSWKTTADWVRYVPELWIDWLAVTVSYFVAAAAPGYVVRRGRVGAAVLGSGMVLILTRLTNTVGAMLGTWQSQFFTTTQYLVGTALAVVGAALGILWIHRKGRAQYAEVEST